MRIVVPYAPGGAVDVVARKLAQKLSEQTGQSFFVENKPGASGTIGAQSVIRAARGRLHLAGARQHVLALAVRVQEAAVGRRPAGGPDRGERVYAGAGTRELGLEVSRISASLIAFAKANPDKLTYGTGGNGSAPHFSAEAFQQAAGVKLSHIPYKGAGEAVTGLVGSQIDLVLLSTGSVASQLKAGKLRALAASGSKRLASFPNIPTFAEAGLPGFGIMNWSGLAAPPGRPRTSSRASTPR